MSERALLAAVAVILTLITLVSVAGHGHFAGPVLITLTPTHGIDLGDVPVALGWLAGMVSLATLWRRLP